MGSSFITDNESTATALEAGQPITMRISVNAKKTGNYVMIEAPIPAGCSYGSTTGRNNYFETHREYFKNKVAIFCELLPQGEHFFDVKLEPRFAGAYTLNPTKAELMYFPTFSGNNELRKVRIVE